jgi:hypothetical protein
MLDQTTQPKMPECFPDGVYFGLDESKYHADSALGSSDIRALLKHPSEYWHNSWMNPQREREETDYLAWGTAFHVLILQGMEAFLKRYYRGPSREDHEGLLETMADMKKWLQLRGFAQTGLKAELVKRVLNADPNAPVWDEIERKAQLLAGDRLVLKPKVFDQIIQASGYISNHPDLSKAFQNGYPEVSVFWTAGKVYVEDYGEWPLRLKARIDYLKYLSLTDLKSFRAWEGEELDITLNKTIGYHGYYIQAAHYITARQRIPAFFREGKVFGDVSKAWVDRFLELSHQKFLWLWVFYQATGAPVTLGVYYDPEAPYFDVGLSDINRALERYRRYMSVFGTTQWVDVSAPRTLTMEDLPYRLASVA